MEFVYDKHIHPHDEMFTWLLRKGRTRTQAFMEYMASGYTICRNIEDILTGTGRRITRDTTVLDFASGYGRLTRFLIRDIDPVNITVMDINPEAVRFQTAQFGVNGLCSTEDPRALTIGKRFDIVICISLFSHLPKDSFARWLDALFGLCAKRGILIFTTHPFENDSAGSRASADSESAKFRYARKSESRLLPFSQYGTSYVNRSFVESVIGNRVAGKIIAYIPKGLNNHQDVYVIGHPAEEARDVPIRALPCGCIDSIAASGDKTLVSGWAYDPESGSPVRGVTIYCNGRMRGQGRTGLKRADVAKYLNAPDSLHSGFVCSCEGAFGGEDTVCAAVEGGKTSSLLFYRAYREHPLYERIMPAINAVGNLLQRTAGRGRRP